jgi:hypothetical protein
VFGWVMMQTVLTKYWLTLHIGLLLLVSWFRLSEPCVQGLVSLLWLSLVAVEAMVLLPSVRRNETLADARMRVARAVVWDPFFYFGISLLCVVLSQWLNSGCSLIYLADADRWQFSDPPVSWLPYSVEPAAALTYVSLFVACAVGGVILRQGVSKSAKRGLLQAASALSGMVAFCMVWLASFGVEPYAGIARAPHACAPGSFFGFWLVVGMGAYVDALTRSQRGSEALFLLAFLGNLLGMLFFASASALVVYTVIALLLAVYWLVYLNANVPKHVQLKLFMVLLVVIVSVTLALVYVFPENPVAAKVKSLFALEQFWSNLSATKQVRTSAAIELWKEHPWGGVGADGFRHYLGTVIKAKDWPLVKADQAFAYNDCLQFLCEFGSLGAGLLIAAVITLMVPICYRARLAWQIGGTDVNAGRVFLLRLSPLVVTGVLAMTLCFLESWIANPFRSPALFLSWVLVMAMVPAFLPTKSTVYGA